MYSIIFKFISYPNTPPKILLLKINEKKINCYVGVSKECKHRYNAKQIISELVLKFSAKGGGNPTFGTSVIIGQKTSVVLNYIKEMAKA